MSNGSFHFYSPSVFSKANLSLLCKIRFKTRPGNGYVMHVLEFMSVYLYFKFPTHGELNKTFWWKCAYSFQLFSSNFWQLLIRLQVASNKTYEFWWRARWQEVGILFVYKNTMGFGTLTIFTCLWCILHVTEYIKNNFSSWKNHFFFFFSFMKICANDITKLSVSKIAWRFASV